MTIFNKKKKSETKIGTAPEEPETPGEIRHIENLSEDTEEDIKPEPQATNYQQIPVCLSQTQINNLIIENNMMLKQIISNMD